MSNLNDDSRSWVVCWTMYTGINSPVCEREHWSVFESYEEAKALYDDLYHRDSTYIRSICAVMESSDYETHEAFKMEATA